MKVEESSKIRQEMCSIALNVRVDDLDHPSDPTWSCVSLMYVCGSANSFVSSQVPTPTAVSSNNGGVKMVTEIIKSVSKIRKLHTKPVQHPKLNSSVLHITII